MKLSPCAKFIFLTLIVVKGFKALKQALNGFHTTKQITLCKQCYVISPRIKEVVQEII